MLASLPFIVAVVVYAWHETPLTVVMVTHDLRAAFSLATRVIALERTRNRPAERERFGATISHDIEVWPRRIAGQRPTIPGRDDPAAKHQGALHGTVG